jgi:hypothetical protein
VGCGFGQYGLPCLSVQELTADSFRSRQNKCEAIKRFCSVRGVESPWFFLDCQGSFYVGKSMSLHDTNQIFAGTSVMCVSFVLYTFMAFLVKTKLMEFMLVFV